MNVVAETDDVITQVREVKALPFTNLQIPPKLATRVEMVGQRKSYVVDCPNDTFRGAGLLRTMGPCKAGDVIARGYYDTGDHVFVDKNNLQLSQAAKRGSICLQHAARHSDAGKQEARHEWSVGSFTSSDWRGCQAGTLQIRPPELFINGNRASGFGFERVMAAQGEYDGYSNGSRSPMGSIMPMKSADLTG